ncbi:hypothetical protein FF38_02871 [Lucilia cuprina]|uniref:Uncharacterized protein n=1 Tax=Lucilia cuprina TaxID=7375 RepID=A0A0L0CL57_LUCCU|nr:hypothetical protein FF38_02871 [Lucilia cuprina]
MNKKCLRNFREHLWAFKRFPGGEIVKFCKDIDILTEVINNKPTFREYVHLYGSKHFTTITMYVQLYTFATSNACTGINNGKYLLKHFHIISDIMSSMQRNKHDIKMIWRYGYMESRVWTYPHRFIIITIEFHRYIEFYCSNHIFDVKVKDFQSHLNASYG